MKRRHFMRLLGGVVAWPVVARAQQRVHPRRLGVLMPFRESDVEAQRRLTVFSETLRQIGWVEGQSFVFEKRFSEGKPERLRALAAELVNANVDVVVTQSSESVDALRVATTTIPIVMAAVGDALGAGYVASLARPGGNITGLTLVATEQGAKRLQLIKQLSPAIVRVAVLLNRNASGHGLQLKEMEPAAKTLDLVLQPLAVRTASDIDGALHAAMQEKAQAIITMDDPMILSQRVRIAEFGLQQFMPVFGEFRPTTQAGALMNYGPNPIDLWKRAAGFVDRIFKGAKPADLPVEQPTKFELVINLKTAKTLGLTVPPGLLAVADEVIE
jgi:putative tryptophan/tyrosine transport system substrate-binding protein